MPCCPYLQLKKGSPEGSEEVVPAGEADHLVEEPMEEDHCYRVKSVLDMDIPIAQQIHDADLAAGAEEVVQHLVVEENEEL